MDKISHIKHAVSVVLGILVAIITPALTTGALANYSWAPLALAAAVYIGRMLRGTLPPGPPAVVALVIAAVMGGSFGCWLTKPPPVVPTAPDGGFADASPGTTFIDCSDSAIHAAWVNLIPTAETAVATGNIDAAVAVLAASIGAPLAISEFICAVEWVVMKAQQQAPSTADSLEATKVANGNAWLARQAQRSINVTP